MAAPKSNLNVGGSTEYGLRREKRRKQLGRAGAGAKKNKDAAEMWREDWDLWEKIRNEKVRRNFSGREAHKALKKAS